MLTLDIKELAGYVREDGFLESNHYRVGCGGSPWLIEIVPNRGRGGGWCLNVLNAETLKYHSDASMEFQDEFVTYCFDLLLFQVGFEWLQEHYPLHPTVWDHLEG